MAGRKPERERKPKSTSKSNQVNEPALTRLNKYIANSGVCSRRDADELIASGKIKVNGATVTNLGTKVTSADKVEYNGKLLRAERQVYVLLNKPKDFITTTEDTHGRKTVMDLVEKACKERIFPVGRLDRATTGLLLFTNDGYLAKKLTHPSHQVKKIYRVKINKPLTKTDLESIQSGVSLDDGLIETDEIAILKDDKKEIGLEIHSGRNRVVRRLFEHLGYSVLNLDRVVYADLTKKDLPRGKWRHLKPREIANLQKIK